jgi:hypothetical protein
MTRELEPDNAGAGISHSLRLSTNTFSREERAGGEGTHFLLRNLRGRRATQK